MPQNQHGTSKNEQYFPTLSHQQSCFIGKKHGFWRQAIHLPRPLVFHDHPLPWRWYDKLHILRANNAWRCFTTTPKKKNNEKLWFFMDLLKLSNIDFPKIQEIQDLQWKLLHDLKRKWISCRHKIERAIIDVWLLAAMWQCAHCKSGKSWVHKWPIPIPSMGVGKLYQSHVSVMRFVNFRTFFANCKFQPSSLLTADLGWKPFFKTLGKQNTSGWWKLLPCEFGTSKNLGEPIEF